MPTPPQRGYEPGTIFTPMLATLDDSPGTGQVITFGMADETRTAWRYTGLDGWDSPDIGETAEDRTGADGMWDTDNYYSGRQVTVSGYIEAPSAEVRDAARARLAQALPARGRSVTFSVNEAIPKQVSGRRSGRLMMDTLTSTVVQFSFNLLAVDPRKYGTGTEAKNSLLGESAAGLPIPIAFPAVIPEQDVSGEFFDVTNEGDYETPPTIRITGPGIDMGIANLTTGAILRYDFELAAGDELLIDTNTGAATLNGTTYRAPIPGSTVTARFLLPPGLSHMRFLGSRTDSDVSPLLTLQWRNAWI